MATLTDNENSDVIDLCVPLDESLFREIYNRRIWGWYQELGLVRDGRQREYLHVQDGRMKYDQGVLDEAFAEGHNFLSGLARSFTFASRIITLIKSYDPGKISQIYAEGISKDISAISEDERMALFTSYWETLVANFRYVVAANLILLYRLKPTLPPELTADIVARRYNLILDLNEGKMTKQEFDAEVGYLAAWDYDFTSPRYYEQDTVVLPALARTAEHPGIHNFREYVKRQNIMMIALIRRLLLPLGEDIFYLYKEEILNKERPDVPARKAAIGRSVEPLAQSDPTRASDPSQTSILTGRTFSGAGVTEGTVLILDSPSDMGKSQQGDIVVSDTLNPDLVLLFSRSSGIIAERGGSLSHLAVVARESGFPVIGQVENARNILRVAHHVRLNLNEGTVIILN